MAEDILYPIWRKWYVRISWYLSYFYNIIICIFFYHPNIVNMSLDDVDNVILHICKIFCIIDICSSPFIPCFIEYAIMDLMESISEPFGKMFDTLMDENDKYKIKQQGKKFDSSLNQAKYSGNPFDMINAYTEGFAILGIAAESEERKRQREKKRQRQKFLKENDYELIYLRNTLLNIPHGSLQWYSGITSIYCTIVFILNFTYEGYILWGIYFLLLLNNVFSNQYSLYKDFFKTNEFVNHIIQLIDLSSNYAFLYEIGGINNETIEEYGLIKLIIYLVLFLISYISYISLTYNNFMLTRSVEDNDKKKYEKRILYSNVIYSIFGAIPLSVLTVIINNNDDDETNNEAITILSVSSSILTFILSLSEILTVTYQQDYIKNS